MHKQLPPGVFTALVVVALLSAALIIGTGTRQSGTVADGKSAPAIEGIGLGDGKPLKASDLKGKVVLVNFWATWCGPCAMEIPELVKLQEKYGARGFSIVGLSADVLPEKGQTDPVPPFIAQMKINYPVLRATHDMADGLGGVEAFPTSFLLDKDGKVVFSKVGYAPGVIQEFEKEIEKRL